MLVKIGLWARPGVLTLPGGLPVLFWGLAASSTAEPQLPGPQIEARVGDDLEITLYNRLPEPVSLMFPGQELLPDPVTDGNGQIVSLARPADPGGSIVYRFPVTRPGTFRYESGTAPERQVQMGLYGSLLVRPADYDDSDPGRRTAYGADSGSNYDLEHTIILGELDLAVHNSIAVGAVPNPLDYAPQYWLINGRPFPDCAGPDDASAQPLSGRIYVTVGQQVLLRVINSGFLPHSLVLPGGPARVVAEDGWPLYKPPVNASYKKHALTVAPGQTYDLLFSPPAGEMYLYDRDLLHLVNADEYPGGIMTIIDSRTDFSASVPGDPVNLTAVRVGPGRVELSWDTGGGEGDGVVVERGTGLTGAFQRLTTLLGEATAFSDETAPDNTLYIYRILAFNARGTSGYSNYAVVSP